jgi:hypothetical protein
MWSAKYFSKKVSASCEFSGALAGDCDHAAVAKTTKAIRTAADRKYAILASARIVISDFFEGVMAISECDAVPVRNDADGQSFASESIGRHAVPSSGTKLLEDRGPICDGPRVTVLIGLSQFRSGCPSRIEPSIITNHASVFLRREIQIVELVRYW